jgi:hypothetical protein
VDIDDVLSQTSVYAIEKMRQDCGFDLQYADISDHHWHLLPNCPLSEGEMLKFWDRHLGDAKSVERIRPIE